MVGPSITDADREQFLVKLKVGFALLVGVSMGMVALHGGADLPIIVGVTIGTTAFGGLVAWIAIPDSVAGMPFETRDTRVRGPKPGTRTKQRRRADHDEPRRADGTGRDERQR
jgi:pimeloyl-ACP methyl ester carboxylesterase